MHCFGVRTPRKSWCLVSVSQREEKIDGCKDGSVKGTGGGLSTVRQSAFCIIRESRFGEGAAVKGAGAEQEIFLLPCEAGFT